MSSILVCSLAEVPLVARENGVREMISILGAEHLETPPALTADRHLRLSFDDVSLSRPGVTIACETDIKAALDFAGDWDRSAPLLVHCRYGMGRSPAMAFVIACSFNPGREPEVAKWLRSVAPFIMPNRRVVELGSQILRRPEILEAFKPLATPVANVRQSFSIPAILAPPYEDPIAVWGA